MLLMVSSETRTSSWAEIFILVLVAVTGLLTAIALFFTHHIKISINSRMDQLLAVVKKASHAEGLQEGRDEKMDDGS